MVIESFHDLDCEIYLIVDVLEHILRLFKQQLLVIASIVCQPGNNKKEYIYIYI
jgi:hypothetical protein